MLCKCQRRTTRNLFWEYRVFQNTDFPHRGNYPGSSAPWSAVLALVGFVGLCLLVSVAAAAVTAPNLRTWYLSLTPPPGTPPNWLFAPVWTTLYVLIGIAAWLVWRRPRHRRPLLIWGWQLLCSALWTPAFFGLHSPTLGLCVVVPLLMLIGLTIRVFVRTHRLAAALMVPYAAWACYAAYLNAGFWWLNSA